MNVANQLEELLADDRFRDESTDCDLNDAVIVLAQEFGWLAVDTAMLDVLRDEAQSSHWYDVVACLFGTDCHERQLPCEPAYLIALLYDCLKLCPKLGVPGMELEATDNLVWSITHNLKQVGYLIRLRP